MASFSDPEVERAYLAHLNRAQVPMDVASSVLGAMYTTVLTRKVFEIEGAYSTAGLSSGLTVVYFLLLLVTIWRGRLAYAAVRQSFILAGLPSVWFFGCQAAEALNKVQLPASASGSWALLFILLLRCQVIMLFWANLSVRLPVRRHVLAHSLSLLIVASWNGKRCRWMLGEAPWLRDWCLWVVRQARRAALFGAPPALGTSSSAQEADDPGQEECVLILTFLQLTVGTLLPFAITFALETNSRRRFMQRMRRQQQGQQLGQQEGRALPPQLPLRPGNWLSGQILMGALLVAILSWHVVEVAVPYFSQ